MYIVYEKQKMVTFSLTSNLHKYIIYVNAYMRETNNF